MPIFFRVKREVTFFVKLWCSFLNYYIKLANVEKYKMSGPKSSGEANEKTHEAGNKG